MPEAPAAISWAGRPLLYANLSPMLPQRPTALDADFVPDFVADFSQSGVACTADADRTLDHHCQICPTCSARRRRPSLQARLLPVRLLPELCRLLLRTARPAKSHWKLRAGSRWLRYLPSLALRAGSNSSPSCHSIGFFCSPASQPRTNPKRASLALPRKSQSAWYSSDGW
jgi:hypothetical protein